MLKSPLTNTAVAQNATVANHPHVDDLLSMPPNLPPLNLSTAFHTPELKSSQPRVFQPLSTSHALPAMSFLSPNYKCRHLDFTKIPGSISPAALEQLKNSLQAPCPLPTPIRPQCST